MTVVLTIYKCGYRLYNGGICNSLPHGYGKLYNKSNICVYEGLWVKGVREGEGSAYCNKRGICIFKGIWKNGKWTDGILYKEGKQNGKITKGKIYLEN